MPATLTHASILLLARRRLRRLHRDLASKSALRSNPLSDLELRVAHLARHADAMLSTPPWAEPPGDDSLAGGISKFALLGSMGPDVPAFAALLAPGQGWIFDTVHKGGPDSHREAVDAGTTDLALEIWTRAAAAVTAEVADATARKRILAQIRAYVLGHLAHLAGDTVGHSYVNSVEWRRALPSFKHHEVEGSIDARVARRVLGRASIRSGKSWGHWWPSADDLPPQLPAAWAEALERVYKLSASRPKGFAEFEKEHLKRMPPRPSPELMRDGFKVFSSGAIGIAYGWGWGHWFGALSLFTLPLLALPVLVVAAPRTRRILRGAASGGDPEETWSDLLTLPLAAASLSTIAAAAVVAGITVEGVERYSTYGLVAAGLNAVLGVISLVTVLGEPAPATPLRWLVLFGVPVVAGLVHLTQLDRPRIGKLPFLHAVPLGVLVVFGIVGLIAPVLSKEQGTFGLWVALVVTFWIAGSKKLRDIRIPEEPEALPADSPHRLRLFDDATLFQLPAAPGPGPVERFYPSGRRKLLLLSVAPGVDLQVRSEGGRLAFSSDGITPDLLFAPPVVPSTATELAALLEAAVPGLVAEVAAPKDDYVLPAGFTFAVDEKERDQPGLGELLPPFVKVGSADKPTEIFHAPKAALAVRFDVNGNRAEPDELLSELVDETGFRFVHDPLAAGDGATMMDLAADFAALLLLGGASRMLSAAERAVPETTQPVGEIQQVFRNWNLDRRRLDEWRLLVAGGAPGAPGASPGENTASEVGWVPLLRKWHDAARQPDVDVTEERALHPDDPSLSALSSGMAWLLDLPDPLRVR